MNSTLTVIMALLIAVFLIVAGYGLISFAVDKGDQAIEEATEDEDEGIEGSSSDPGLAGPAVENFRMTVSKGVRIAG